MWCTSICSDKKIMVVEKILKILKSSHFLTLTFHQKFHFQVFSFAKLSWNNSWSTRKKWSASKNVLESICGYTGSGHDFVAYCNYHFEEHCPTNLVFNNYSLNIITVLNNYSFEWLQSWIIFNYRWKLQLQFLIWHKPHLVNLRLHIYL